MNLNECLPCINYLKDHLDQIILNNPVSSFELYCVEVLQSSSKQVMNPPHPWLNANGMQPCNSGLIPTIDEQESCAPFEGQIEYLST